MVMRTPLSKVRGLGTAKSGTEHFWLQRLTAVANIPLVLFFLASIVANMGADYEQVLNYMSKPWVAIGFLLLIISGVYHMYLGMQVIIEDYVHSEACKVASLMFNVFFSAVIALSSIFAILKISLGVF